MALSKTVLSGLFATNIAAKVAANGGKPLTNPADMFDAFADAIVTHMTSAAEVDTTTLTLLAPMGGGPVTGTTGIK